MRNPQIFLTDVMPVSIRWETDGGFHRESRLPGADISDLPQEMQDALAAHWTPERVEEWEGSIAEPEVALPETPTLSARQLRIGLVSNGFSLQQVEAAISAIPDEQQRTVALIEWEYAVQFKRDHPLIEQVGSALGLSSEQIDAMWTAALSL